ncbi:hypothetical protein BD289DRAFT_368886 [Coniella lustricola]|uniref:Uncharacterized protein n=1 Tax=Coniella lustricola TaxID=2025994 RepID=A0A2T3A7L2_9PEZI|nr:hypothetical protein BD289DRAFT_368886 [Coniella lustricola]
MLLSLSSIVSAASSGLTNSSLTTYVDSASLNFNFDPVKAAYWTGYIHHRRTPFAVSPSGDAAYLAYLDGSGTDVHVQQIDPTTFAATGINVTVSGGKEAGGLVAQDDGFALLTNEAMPTGTTNAPADNTPVPVLYRYSATGAQQWKTWLGGPNVTDSEGHMAATDMNGDLVYSNTTGRYAAYTVVTAYDGDADGHFGDAIRYVEDTTGELVVISGASSDWGCSHNTGIALEAADAAPYASICAEDQGGIWLNSQGQGMSTDGVKISNENTTNGADGEPMGGMSGSYSNLARFQNSDAYIFAWVTRGAINLYENAWMGEGYTNAYNRTNGRNVALATFSDKYTMNEAEASSTVGAASGDSQINWLTTSTTADQSNAHVATFDGSNALVSWEEIADPFCEYIAFGCRGTFTGSYFQLVSTSADANGTAVGEPLVKSDVYVSGDMVTMADGRICWPYVNMDWDLSGVVGWSYTSSNVTSMSFACMSLDATTSSSSSSSTTAASSSAVAVQASTSSVAAQASTSSLAAQASTSSLAAQVSTSSVAEVVAAASSTAAAEQAATTLATSVVAASATRQVSSSSATSTQAVAAATTKATGGHKSGGSSSGSWFGGFGW